MKRKVLGAVLIVAGAALLLISHNITEQVASGQMQINKGQKQVNTVNSLFNATPYTRGAGGIVTGGAQEQINQGRQDVAYYSQLAQMLNIGGIVLIVAGAGILLIPRRRPQ